MLGFYDRKDVLKVASSHDSFVQLNLDCRGPATSALIVARGWAEPLPDLASPIQEWSPIVFWRFTDTIATLLITPGIFRAPIVALTRVGTRIRGPTTRVCTDYVMPLLAAPGVFANSPGVGSTIDKLVNSSLPVVAERGEVCTGRV